MIRSPKTSATLLLFLSLCLAACIGEDLSDCPAGKGLATLRFNLPGVDSAGFLQRIKSVDVVLYDADNRYVLHTRLDKDALDVFEGLRLSLAPGDYKVVCWGNVSANTRLSPFNTGETTLELSEVEMTNQAGGDTLYYAPAHINPYAGQVALTRAGEEATDPAYALTVPEGGETVKYLDFCRAYRTINVYVEGLPVDDESLPLIEAAGLYTKYDFLFNTLPYRRNFTQTCATVSTSYGTLLLARFFSAYAPVSDDIVLTLKKTPAGPVLALVNLLSYLRKYPEANKDDMDILITFAAGVMVDITLPDWDKLQVGPVF